MAEFEPEAVRVTRQLPEEIIDGVRLSFDGRVSSAAGQLRVGRTIS
ncbi:hypothetical protein [Ruania rhizosphaerae]|nr:hypothetical protein [Ruania rhizosphaerae]